MSELAVQYNGVYKRISDLPPAVRHALKGLSHAMDTWRKAYNAAATSGKYKSKSAAYQIAWAAVQHRYEKDKNGDWREKPGWTPAKDALELDGGAFHIDSLERLAASLELVDRWGVAPADVEDHIQARAYALTQ